MWKYLPRSHDIIIIQLFNGTCQYTSWLNKEVFVLGGWLLKWNWSPWQIDHYKKHSRKPIKLAYFWKQGKMFLNYFWTRCKLLENTRASTLPAIKPCTWEVLTTPQATELSQSQSGIFVQVLIAH